jgi:hypothetical protein
MTKELIRSDILNLTLEEWEKVNEIEKSGFIEVTPMELLDLIGFHGGIFFSSKANERETEFINSYYEIGRRLRNNI